MGIKRKFLNKNDVMKLTRKKDTWASQRIKKLNDELEAKGYMICRGRVPVNYFCDRHGLDVDGVLEFLNEVENGEK